MQDPCEGYGAVDNALGVRLLDDIAGTLVKKGAGLPVSSAEKWRRGRLIAVWAREGGSQAPVVRRAVGGGVPLTGSAVEGRATTMRHRHESSRLLRFQRQKKKKIVLIPEPGLGRTHKAKLCASRLASVRVLDKNNLNTPKVKW